MSMDPKIWLKTLPHSSGKNEQPDHEIYNLDPNKWVNTLPKKNIKNSSKKYSLLTILFIIGLISVSVIKNETRNLEKEISNLRASVSALKLDLHQSTLDHQVITSPENISKLAKEYLENDFDHYNKSQIKHLGDKKKNLSKLIKTKKLKEKGKKIKNEIRTKIAKKIEAQSEEYKKLYKEPKKILTESRIQRWAGIQVVKAFFGIPIVPGR